MNGKNEIKDQKWTKTQMKWKKESMPKKWNETKPRNKSGNKFKAQIIKWTKALKQNGRKIKENEIIDQKQNKDPKNEMKNKTKAWG